jgi:hypothetical protein
MVIYETISGNLPFHKDTDLMVFVKVLEGERPTRGVRFTGGLWWILEQCWGSQPNNRPTVEDVLHHLEALSNLPESCSPKVDEGMEVDSDDGDSTNSSSGVSNGGGIASTPTSSDLSE